MAHTLVYTLGLGFRSAAGLEVVVLGINLFGAVVEVRTGAFWVVAMVMWWLLRVVLVWLLGSC